MNKMTLHTLASDKLYLLAYIKLSQGTIKRRELVDRILKEGRMNYFFLCQYLSELEDADFIQDREHVLVLTQEGNEALDMFADQLQSTDILSLKTEQLDYRIFKKGDMTVLEKIKDGDLIFSLSCTSEILSLEDESEIENLVENIIREIKKAGSS